MFKEAFEWIQTAGWPLDFEMLKAYDSLRLAVASAGRHDLAADLAAGVVDRLRKQPSTPPETLNTQVFALASHLLWGGHPDQAEPLLRETLTVQNKLDPDGWQITKNTLFLHCPSCSKLGRLRRKKQPVTVRKTTGVSSIFYK